MAKRRSRIVTGKKDGRRGRYVTLRGGRVILIPIHAGPKKWVDVREKVEQRAEE